MDYWKNYREPKPAIVKPPATIRKKPTFDRTPSTNLHSSYKKLSVGIDVGQKAFPFKLLTVKGKEIELGSFAKDKVTLLMFSTTWCPSCRHEIPILKEYYSELKDDGLNVLGIDIKESVKKVKSLVDKMQINYPVALDSDEKVRKLYKVVGIPLNIILDKNGVIVYKENKPPSKEFLKGLL